MKFYHIINCFNLSDKLLGLYGVSSLHRKDYGGDDTNVTGSAMNFPVKNDNKKTVNFTNNDAQTMTVEQSRESLVQFASSSSSSFQSDNSGEEYSENSENLSSDNNSKISKTSNLSIESIREELRAELDSEVSSNVLSMDDVEDAGVRPKIASVISMSIILGATNTEGEHNAEGTNSHENSKESPVEFSFADKKNKATSTNATDAAAENEQQRKQGIIQGNTNSSSSSSSRRSMQKARTATELTTVDEEAKLQRKVEKALKKERLNSHSGTNSTSKNSSKRKSESYGMSKMNVAKARDKDMKHRLKKEMRGVTIMGLGANMEERLEVTSAIKENKTSALKAYESAVLKALMREKSVQTDHQVTRC